MWFNQSADYMDEIPFDTFDDLQRGLKCIEARRNLKHCLFMLRGTRLVLYAAVALPRDTQIVELQLELPPGTLATFEHPQCLQQLRVHTVCFVSDAVTGSFAKCSHEPENC